MTVFVGILTGMKRNTKGAVALAFESTVNPRLSATIGPTRIMADK